MSETPIEIGTASVIWGGFLGDVVRQSLEAQAGGQNRDNRFLHVSNRASSGGPYDYQVSACSKQWLKDL